MWENKQTKITADRLWQIKKCKIKQNWGGIQALKSVYFSKMIWLSMLPYQTLLYHLWIVIAISKNCDNSVDSKNTIQKLTKT